MTTAPLYSLRRRPDPSVSRASEAGLLVLLVLTLLMTWPDGATPNESMTTVATNPQNLTPWPTMAVGLTAILPSPPVIEPSPSPSKPAPTSPPVKILIPTMDVHRPVEPVGVDSAGAMIQPSNDWSAGWYDLGPVPGAPGDAVIEGHAGYPGAPLIFGRLVNLRPGDQITVVLADGTSQLFVVASSTTVPAGGAPPFMGAAFGPPRLTLITCTGHFDANQITYSDRLVVEATYIGPA
jgi:hypothetical protein